MVTASWGEAADLDDQSAVTTDVPRTGLAAARSVFVTTARTRGHDRTLLCTDRRIRARLPTLNSRQSIGAVSVNGSYVAWSVVAKGRRGIVNVARVERGRLRAIRRTRQSTGSGTNHSVSTGAFVVLGNGTTAWSLPSNKKSEGAVWIRGGSPVPFSRGVLAGPLPVQARPGFFGRNVSVLDDRNVLLDDVILRAYRPPTPGRCPALTVGRWRELAGWQEANVGGYGDEGSEQIDSSERSVVCDPTTGRYLDVSTARYHNGKGNSGRMTFGTVARNGRWLLRSLIGEGDDLEDTAVTLTDTTTGERHVAGGNLDVPGIPHPAETPENVGPNFNREQRWQTGAVITPGATAWIERAPYSTTPATDAVWLSDRAGTTGRAGRAWGPVGSGRPRGSGPPGGAGGAGGQGTTAASQRDRQVVGVRTATHDHLRTTRTLTLRARRTRTSHWSPGCNSSPQVCDDTRKSSEPAAPRRLEREPID